MSKPVSGSNNQLHPRNSKYLLPLIPLSLPLSPPKLFPLKNSARNSGPLSSPPLFPLSLLLSPPKSRLSKKSTRTSPSFAVDPLYRSP
ncbi:hypothetical protein TorRG33x02_232370 [Trema orientale]|uniref:Uncharacterized protein n=1 Tax=Trema orientale TaxID=63057 RepID=A0A2P5E627_TREOI|nr:hypothetical protein TorRG33x02_232370 [Trema orientale]